MTTSRTRLEWIAHLDNLGACREAVEWASAYPTLAEAWAVCDRADWMLWLAGKHAGPPQSASRKRLVLCACACWRRGVPLARQRGAGLSAIETAERWARGEAGVTLADVYAAAAYAAADAAAADAADAAAAYAAGAAAAGRTALKAMADVVRQHYPDPPALGGAS